MTNETNFSALFNAQTRIISQAKEYMITTSVNYNWLGTKGKTFNFNSLVYNDLNFNNDDLKTANEIQYKIQNNLFDTISKREWLQFEYYRLKLSILEYAKKNIKQQLNELKFIGRAHSKNGKLYLTMIVSFNIEKSSIMVSSALGVNSYNVNTLRGKHSIDFGHDNNKFHSLLQLIRNHNDSESSFKSSNVNHDMLEHLSFYLRSNVFVIKTLIKESFDWTVPVFNRKGGSCLEKLSKNYYKLASELLSDSELKSFKKMHQLYSFNKNGINTDYYLFYLYVCVKLNYFVREFELAKRMYIDSSINKETEIQQKRKEILNQVNKIKVVGAVMKDENVFLDIRFPKKTTQNLVSKYINVPVEDITPQYYEKSFLDAINKLRLSHEYQPRKFKTFH